MPLIRAASARRGASPTTRLPQGERRRRAHALTRRHHHDALVLGPAHPPGEVDVPDLARLGLERPFQHAALVAQIGRGRRRRRRQHLDLDVLVLADRQLILDRDPDREVMAVAHRGLERAFVGLRRRHDQAGRSLVALDDGALDLDLVVGAETEPHGFVLAGGGHLAAADEHAVAIDRDPAGQQRRVLVLLEAGFEERGRDPAPARRGPRDRAQWSRWRRAGSWRLRWRRG